jgi:hypothetical protein
MPTIIGHHKITKGSEHWVKSKRRQELFRAHGVTNIRTFVDPQDSTRVALMMDVVDLATFAAVMKTAEAAEAMAFDGVVPESLVILVEA